MKNIYFLFMLLGISLQLDAQLVTTVAGQPENAGSNDGNVMEARFNNPHGIAVDQKGNVYTADRWSHIIRKITPEGQVTTLAGTPEVVGDQDGTGAAARFNEPWGLCVDGKGNVFVADTRNNKIRKITPDGVVTTVAGTGNFGTSDGRATASTFGNPTGIEVDEAGVIYVADHLTHLIRKINTDGTVQTLAGQSYAAGALDGTGRNASFNRPYGLTLDNNGDILVADEWNHKIRRVTPDGVVTTVAGDGIIAGDNGPAASASFNFPWDVTVDANGNIFVADGYNYQIRKISPEGEVTSYAGAPQQSGATDGEGEEATFSGATSVAVSPTE
ncbi:MAG: NHL repeat-containing protein, partial [Bacteroidota bacterium]